MAYDGAQAILRKYGATAAELLFAVPLFVGSTPSSSYRDSASAQIIIKGLQRGLNNLGAGLQVDGKLGTNTEAAIVHISGPNYREKKWIEIYADLDKATRAGFTMPRVVAGEISSMPFSTTSTEPLPWILIAVAGLGAYAILR